MRKDTRHTLFSDEERMRRENKRHITLTCYAECPMFHDPPRLLDDARAVARVRHLILGYPASLPRLDRPLHPVPRNHSPGDA